MGMQPERSGLTYCIPMIFWNTVRYARTRIPRSRGVVLTAGHVPTGAMRATSLPRAIAAFAAAAALAISPVLTGYAAAQRPLADVNFEEWRTLSDACSNEKAAALAVLFPNGATAQQQEDFDHAFAQRLTGASSAQLMPQWQAFSEQSAAGAPHAAENAFAACVYHARIRQLDPNAVFATPAQSQTDQLFANLPRRDSGAGASMIAESLDPAARAERQRLQQQADAERQARQQQAAANNAAFWDTLLGVVATVGSAYVNYESQRAQIEAGNQAAAAQAAANAALQQQQQQAAAAPPQQGAAYTYLNGQCVGYGCPSGSNAQANIDLDACVTASMEFIPAAQAGNGMNTYTVWFQNTCPNTLSVHARDSRGTVQWDTLYPARGAPTRAHVLCTNCSGFSEWWVNEGPHHPIGGH